MPTTRELIKEVIAYMSKSIVIVKKGELNLCVLIWKDLQVKLLNFKSQKQNSLCNMVQLSEKLRKDVCVSMDNFRKAIQGALGGTHLFGMALQ